MVAALLVFRSKYCYDIYGLKGGKMVSSVFPVCRLILDILWFGRSSVYGRIT